MVITQKSKRASFSGALGMIKYYPLIVLARFYLIVVIITTLQGLGFLQVLLIFCLQIAFFTVWGRKIIKFRFLRGKLEYCHFFVLEISLATFFTSAFIKEVT